jgi:hypothetical protein
MGQVCPVIQEAASEARNMTSPAEGRATSAAASAVAAGQRGAAALGAHRLGGAGVARVAWGGSPGGGGEALPGARGGAPLASP